MPPTVLRPGMVMAGGKPIPPGLLSEINSIPANAPGRAVVAHTSSGDIPFDTEARPEIIINPGTPSEQRIPASEPASADVAEFQEAKAPIAPVAAGPVRPGVPGIPPHLEARFEALGRIPAAELERFLKSRVVSDPQYIVGFYTELGVMYSRYHRVEEVSEPLHQLILVYDTRHIGQLFVPAPQTKSPMRISVAFEGQKKEYSVFAPGVGFHEPDTQRTYVVLFVKEEAG